MSLPEKQTLCHIEIHDKDGGNNNFLGKLNFLFYLSNLSYKCMAVD